MHPYMPDSRGAKLIEYKVSPNPRDESQEVLLVCASPEIEAQIEVVAGGDYLKGNLSDKAASKYTSGYRFHRAVGADLISFMKLLQTVVTLTENEDIEVSISLDWYKESDEFGGLQNTTMGTLVNRTKHAPHPEWSGSRTAWASMVDVMVSFIQTHPFYRTADIITAPPGHLADGNSWGERLAKAVASATGQTFVPMIGQGPRPARKEADNADLDLSNEFTMTQTVEGQKVVVIDDVYHTGITLRGAAMACRRAGAAEVLTATVARTLSK
jgi:hypothetical protein